MAKSESKKKEEISEGRRFTTCEFRVSYPHLFKAHSVKGSTSEPKFSITMLIPKSSDLAPLKAALTLAKKDYYGAKDNWPDDLESPVQNGDDAKFEGKEGYAGHWVIKATSKQDQKPVVVDKSNSEILDPAQIYPGCYAKAHIFSYRWEFMKKEGIGFILDAVQKTRDGKSFSNKKTAEQMFAPLNDDDNAPEEMEETDFR